jgi:hypothetical protein
MISPHGIEIPASRRLHYRLISRTCVGHRELPRNRKIGIGLVGTEGASLDASREHISERLIALDDSFQYRLDRLADALPGSIRSRPGPAITSTKSDSAREFRRQSIYLLFRLLCALDVSSLLGLFQFLPQFGKAAPVGRLGSLVQHLARIAKPGDINLCLLELAIAAGGPQHALSGFVLVGLHPNLPAVISRVG